MVSSSKARSLALAVFVLVSCITLVPLPRVSSQNQARPRRVHPLPEKPTALPARVEELLPTINRTTSKPLDGSEPMIRVGLTTTARSVNVSSTGRLLARTTESVKLLTLAGESIRIEPRTLPTFLAAPPDNAVVEVADTDSPVAHAGNPRRGAPANKKGSTGESVQLVSRVNETTRGTVLFTTESSAPLADFRVPVTFSAEEETLHPVKLNQKKYRGSLEVFANTRGLLTVVNVVPLEEYLRGVVPNELSPGGYPAIEALKAQAVAARSYALSNRARFESEGFDLLPTTRSQVYLGKATEHALTDRAIAETRGYVATFNGEPINALYTSTCGGRTEHAENIFGGDPVAYLKARECTFDSQDPFAPHTIHSSRAIPEIKLAEHASSARDAALLLFHGFQIPARPTDEWLAATATIEDVRASLGRVTGLTKQPFASIDSDAVRPPEFATALSRALDGESRGDVLLNENDVRYLLTFRDADQIPAKHRADVAAMMRDGILALFPDATLRPRMAMTRARVIRSIARALEIRKAFQLHKATARPALTGTITLRVGNADKKFTSAPDAFLFRAFGESLFPVREVSLIGGEEVMFHTNLRGEIDYLEVQPAKGGAGPDHSSAYSNWVVTMSPYTMLSIIGKTARSVGDIADLRVLARGPSRRVLDLKIVGTKGTVQIHGGKIRSALGLREQLFVIDRIHDETGRVKTFVFTGRGWGHGVGMCQVGAYGLARSGLSYEAILKAYYTGISVTRVYQ